MMWRRGTSFIYRWLRETPSRGDGALGYWGGENAALLARSHRILEATPYNWKARYGGLDLSEARRLKALEEGTGS